MEELYYKDSYKKDFIAEVINVLEIDGKYHIELDFTYFYPDGREHPFDFGYINSIPVIHVYETNDKIYHVVEKKPLKIHRVKCIINWERRYDYMQQHLGQHILSHCFSELYNSTTLSVNLGDEYSYIDVDKTVSNDEIIILEDAVNKMVLDNIKVEAFYPNKSQLKKLSLGKINPHLNNIIRVIKIGEDNTRICTGIHLSSTIEVQLIKIIKFEKHKQGTRIAFICGSRAIQNCFLVHKSLEKVCKLLNCNTNNIIEKVSTLSDERNKTMAERESLKTKVLQYEVQEMLNSSENINGVRIFKNIYENKDIKNIHLLASKLIAFEKVIVLFAVTSGDRVQLIFMRSKDLSMINMNTLLKDAITLVDGKGGGSDFSAQGGGKNNNNLNSALDYAYKKINDIWKVSVN